MNADGATAFRSVPRTGVIFVTTEAVRRGYDGHDPQWCNLGQGQPETGLIDSVTLGGEGHLDGLDALAADLLKTFNERNIDDLIVVNAKSEPVGIVDLQDLPKLKLM